VISAVSSIRTNRLRAARELLGVSQVDLARAVGVSQPMISYYESGEKHPGPRVRAAVCEALGIAHERIFPLDPDPNREAVLA
jgi:transcriptional regulator with XRE-family HTH domain